MRKFLFAAAFAVAFQAAQAQEQEKKAYAFVQAGSASVDIDKAGNDASLRAAGATNLTSTVNDTAGAVLLGIGFHVAPQVAIEVAYLKVADYTYKASFTQGTATETFSGSGFGANLVGFLPLAEKVNVFGKVGIWNFSVDATATVSATGGFGQASASSSNTTAMFGVGADFNFTPVIGVRLEYDHFNKVGDDSTIGSSKLDLVSAGLKVSF